MAAELLIADRLTRTFDARLAVSDLSLSVSAGEVVSLLGPNGAGKTTTLRMLAGLLAPTHGSISINHTRISPDTAADARRSVGILTESPGLWDRLSVRLNLLTYARLYGLPNPEQHVNEALALVDLSDRVDDVAGTLSKGLKQRAALARALVHRPRVVLLDEPTSGLDPASARQVRNLIRRLRDEGRAVLVSTHNLVEAEQLSDRIAILKTRLLALDSPKGLRQQTSGIRVTIEVEGDATPWAHVARSLHDATVTAAGGQLTVTFVDTTRVPDLVAALAGAGARIQRVTPDHRSLEEVYLDLVEAH